MTSSIAQAFQQGQDAVFTAFGVAATYNGNAVTVCVNGYDTTIEQYPEVWAAAATVDIRASEITGRPAVGDTVVFDGTTYQVADVLRGDELSWTLALTKEMVRI